MRIIVYTGKGGVGKTSIAAATALRCADLGYRTLVVSTDTAHSLGDSLQVELGPEPLHVTDNLDAQEIDVHYSIEKYWGELQKMAVEMFTEHGVQDVIAEEVAILPGLEEGASLLWLADFVARDSYDVIVIDAAPTAETLRLLTLPDAARWWIQKLLPLGRAAARFLGPVAKPLFGMNAPDVGAVNAVEKLFETLDEVRIMLSDSSVSSMRLVVNAERMVIKETQRTYTYLNLYGYPIDAVVCNRLLPDGIIDPHFRAWKEAQAAHLDLIHECFDPLPLLTAPLFDREMGGLELLRTLAGELFGKRDPSARLYTGQLQSLEPAGNGYILRLPLPLTDKSKVELYRSSDELTLSVGAYRRNIALPRALWPLDVQSARLSDGVLALRFVATEDTSGG